MIKKLSLVLLFLLALTAVVGSASPAVAAPPSGSSHIIVFKDAVNVRAAVPDVAKAYGLQVGFTYEHALKGMSAVVPAGRLQALQRDPRVKYVVEDMERGIDAQITPTGIQRIFAPANSNLDIDATDDFRVDVDVAVIDTGVDFQHPDLNVAGGVNCASGSPLSKKCVAGGDDDHYHGTHVAGTVAALDNGVGVVGVAPGARVWAVKVLNKNGSGYTSWIVAGIDWVAANANTIEVANMSLGGSGYNQAEYDAIQGAVNKGVAFAVAAGNSDADANNYSPAAFNNVLTVSALADFNGLAGGGGRATCRADQDDTLADFSNWGSAVDIAAPGVCILSTYPIEQGEYGTISGTSMASPHVAGALALKASVNNPNSAADVAGLYNAVVSSGNLNWTDDSGDGTKERLLDVSGYTAALIAVGGGGGNTAPSVTISSPANNESFTVGESITFTGSAADAEDDDLSASLVWNSSINGSIEPAGALVSTSTLSQGTHTITASVTDSGGLSGSATITITVEPAPTGGFTLSAVAYKVKGIQYADLAWSGNLANVDVYRNGNKITPTAISGSVYTDSTGLKGGGSATYQVCETGTTTCSNAVTVGW